MDQDLKEVYFDEYCQTCKYEMLKECEMPCCDCLCVPANENSHKPVNWASKDA